MVITSNDYRYRTSEPQASINRSDSDTDSLLSEPIRSPLVPDWMLDLPESPRYEHSLLGDVSSLIYKEPFSEKFPSILYEQSSEGIINPLEQITTKTKKATENRICNIEGYKTTQDSTNYRSESYSRKAIVQSETQKEPSYSCETCKNTQSRKWYRDPQDPTKSRCCFCFYQALTQRKIQAGVSCSVKTCKKTTIHKWYKDPISKTKDICQSCYDKIRNQLKKLKKP